MLHKCLSLQAVIVNAAAVEIHAVEAVRVRVLVIVQDDAQTLVKEAVAVLAQRNVRNSALAAAMVAVKHLVYIFVMALVMAVAKTIVTKHVFKWSKR